MHAGNQRAKPVDFLEWEVDRFNPFIYPVNPFISYGCGATVVSLVTGENPLIVTAANKYNKHYSDNFVLGAMKAKGVSVLKVTKQNISNRKNDTSYRIGSNHVVLVAQLVMKNEASWFIYFGGRQYHNYEVQDTYPTEFLSRPTLSVYLLKHENWRL